MDILAIDEANGHTDRRLRDDLSVGAPLAWPTVRSTVQHGRETSFLVKLLNIGPSAFTYMLSWTDEWDWSWWEENIDKAVSAGANAVRTLGRYSAYTANPARYKERYQRVIDYAHSRGLYTLFTLTDPINGDTPGASDTAGVLAMIEDLTEKYAGNPLILGWDMGNEWTLDTAEKRTLAAAMAAKTRAVHPGFKVTVSLAAAGSLPITGHRQAIAWSEAVSDFIDVHIYFTFSPARYGMLSQILRELSTKPILIGEFGFDVVASSPPYAGGLFGQASMLKALARELAKSNVIGYGFWKIKDSTSIAMMGLWGSDGAARPALETYREAPNRATSAVQDLIRHRTHPVVVDDYQRGGPGDAVGEPSIGKAPVISAGTVLAVEPSGVRVTTKNGGSDYILYDTRSTRQAVYADVATEFPTTVSALLVARATSDYQTRLTVSVTSNGATGYGFRLRQFVAGTEVTSGLEARWYGAPADPTQDLVIPDLAQGANMVSLGLEMLAGYDQAVVLVNDQPVIYVLGLAQAVTTATYAGFAWGSGNPAAANKLRHFEAHIAGRIF